MNILLHIIVSIILIIIYLNAINWLNNLDDIKCECGYDWKKDFIKAFLYILFGFDVFLLYVIYILKYKSETIIHFFINKYYGRNLGYFLIFLFGSLIIFNIIISFIYIENLKKINCKCSEDIRRDIYHYYNIIIGILYILIIIKIIYYFSLALFNKYFI